MVADVLAPKRMLLIGKPISDRHAIAIHFNIVSKSTDSSKRVMDSRKLKKACFFKNLQLFNFEERNR